MRYLFFDVEGANCYRFISKMCTFGYVITNTSFEVQTKIDVIINPESPFDKHIIKDNMNAYPVSLYKSRPNFTYFYSSIKKILQHEDQLIIGWSIENDVRYVYDACKRYNLKQIKYKYLDLQKVIMLVEGLQNPLSLENACLAYDVNLHQFHKSDEDAYLTMKLTKRICKKLDIGVEELFTRFESCVSTVDHFISTLASDEEIQRRLKRRNINGIIKQCKPKKKLENEYIKEGEIYAFTIDVVDFYNDSLKDMIKLINNCNARCVTNLKEANKIICGNEKYEHYKKRYQNEFVSVLTFEELIHLTHSVVK